MEAIYWSTRNNIVPPRNPPARRTVAQIDAKNLRPRRQQAIAAVGAAVRAGGKDAQQQNCEHRELLAREAEEDANCEESRLASLEEEAEAQSNKFLTTIGAWNTHLVSEIQPAIDYVSFRFFDPDGDRYNIV